MIMRRIEKKRNVERLKRVHAFAECTQSELGMIDSLGTEVEVAAGEALTREGHSGREFMAIIDGVARVVRDGREVAVLGAGSFFGEMALLHRVPRNATVVAATPMRVSVFGVREFHALMELIPAAREAIGRAAEERLAVAR